MRFLAGLAFAALAVQAPVAQVPQSDVVDGCIGVITAFFGRAPDPVNVIEDFAELEPPRARIYFGAPFQMEATCDFKDSQKPLGLVEFCLDDSCISKARGAKRFDELELLFNKAGF